MSRILFAWELGANLGHLTRVLPVAETLRKAGHQVMFAVKDLRMAAELLVPRKFGFIQSPICSAVTNVRKPPINYAGLLEAEGWSDRLALLGYLRAWLGIISMTRCDAIVADHSPGALVAGRIAGRLIVPIGNGFEIPPDVEPMPTIRSWEDHSSERLLAMERGVLAHINAVVRSLGAKPYARLGEIFGSHAIFTSWGEFDHYGNREDARYVGSIHGLTNAPSVPWPGSGKHRIIVYMRRAHRATPMVMDMLVAAGACAVCIVPRASKDFQARYSSDSITVVDHPIALGPLLEGATALVGYASIGAMSEALLEGVPLLLIPSTIEQYLCAKRAEATGAGIVVDGKYDAKRIVEAFADLVSDPRYRNSARKFAKRHKQDTVERAVQGSAGIISEWLSKRERNEGDSAWLTSGMRRTKASRATTRERRRQS